MAKEELIKFYSVVLRKSVMIPKSKTKKKTLKGRMFLIGTYKAKGKDGVLKERKAWKIVGAAKKGK